MRARARLAIFWRREGGAARTNLDVLFDLVRVVEHADARVERDAREHLGRVRPVLLLFVHGRQVLADGARLLLKGRDARLYALERKGANLLERLGGQRGQARGHLEQHLARRDERHLLRRDVLDERLEAAGLPRYESPPRASKSSPPHHD